MNRLLLLLAAASAVRAQPFGACDVAGYYADLPAAVTAWTREAISAKLEGSHRNRLTFTNSKRPGANDTWAALIDLDAPEADADAVHLLYADRDIPAIPFGQETWQREHVWPVRRYGNDGESSLASAEGTATFVDVHNLRPATALNKLVRDDRYFGECGVLVPEGSCTVPASGGGAPDTCECSNRLYRPPANVRGDIARVLMYMDVRYNGNGDDPDLVLTDCPVSKDRNEMAYRSQLLRWHAEDPVDDGERRRNDRACGLWQGNRNPFVDFETLPQVLYGDPLPLPDADRLTYPACDEIPTSSPTFTPNVCQSFGPGDIYFFLINSDDPDSVGLFSLEDLPPGMELFLTDNAWNGVEFQDTEGVIKMTVPEGGIAAGTTFGYGPNIPFGSSWENVEGAFSLSTDGEQVFLYCEAASGEPHAMAAISYNGPFAAVGDQASPSQIRVFLDTESALPDNLADSKYGSVVLPHMDNYVYQGFGGGGTGKSELRASIVNASNWRGSDDDRFGLTDDSEGSGAGTTTVTGALVLVAVSIMTMLL